MWVVVVAAVVAVAFGAYRARTDGRFRASKAPADPGALAASPAVEPVEPVAASGPQSGTGAAWAHVQRSIPDAAPGERATLVQFSSAFCAPCRVTRRVLGEVAEVVPGVTHLEVDAEAHLDLVRELGILRTPTTLVLDAAGREVSRAAGAPRKEQVIAALGKA